MSGVVQDQAPVIERLASSASHGGTAVERIDTHATVRVVAPDALHDRPH